MRLFLLCMCVWGLTVGASDNVLKNGDFESVTEVAKGSAPWLMRFIQKKWDFGPGPVAVLPAHWSPNCGYSKVTVIDRKQNPAMASQVHGGQRSLYLEPKNAHLYNTTRLKPGNYRLSVWVKGEGNLLMVNYNYGDANRYLGPGSCELAVTATPEWQCHAKDIQLGNQKEGTTYSLLVILAAKGKIWLDDMVLTPINQ